MDKICLQPNSDWYESRCFWIQIHIEIKSMERREGSDGIIFSLLTYDYSS